MAKTKPAIRSPKAYDMLSSQPVTCIGAAKSERDKIVVSAVAEKNGKEHALSLFGDMVWDLAPYFENSGKSRCQMKISWPDGLPMDLIDDAKAVIYSWMKRGTPGIMPPAASTVQLLARASTIPFLSWLTASGIKRFSEASPIHIANYVHLVKSKPSIKPSYIYSVLRIIDLIWEFRHETFFPLKTNPWGDTTLGKVCGFKTIFNDAGTGKTPIIPADIQSRIFNYCEAILDGSAKIFDDFDQGKIKLGSPKLIRIRDCALYILSITSGMRNSEAVEIETSSWRSEVKNGVEYNWVETVEHKTHKGKVEFLIPSLTIKVLEIMARYAKPFQASLALDTRNMEAAPSDTPNPERMAQLIKSKASEKKIFLGLSQSRNAAGVKQVEVLSSSTSLNALSRVAKAAGVSWHLTPHQCRRTYARCIVESRMGRKSLVFLKWQFKHTSMSMTQLYASNPMQDASIFDEILQEMTSFKVELIESWLSDKPLSGGAGTEIKKLRSMPIESRAAMLTDTASHVHIRATGHGWCLAQERGCGGAGLYEATRCVGCKNGVIDESFSDVWKGLHEQQLELLKIDDAGPAVKQRAERDVKWTSQVMADLLLNRSASMTTNDRADE